MPLCGKLQSTKTARRRGTDFPAMGQSPPCQFPPYCEECVMVDGKRSIPQPHMHYRPPRERCVDLAQDGLLPVAKLL